MFEINSHVVEALSESYHIDAQDQPELSPDVVIATDATTRQKVVVKFHDTAASSDEETNRFRHEISALTKLEHPHIVPVLESRTNQRVIYYVMPLIAGHSLFTRLRKDSRISVQQVALILRQVADALGHVHKKRIVHGDIQVGNVVMTGHHATIIDFGLARPLHERSDAWFDIKSLGEMGYDILTGQSPYGGENQTCTRTTAVTSTPIHISRLRPDLPRGLADLIMRTLDRDSRWNSATEVAAALERYAKRN